jgi:hypothetical protein
MTRGDGDAHELRHAMLDQVRAGRIIVIPRKRESSSH